MKLYLEKRGCDFSEDDKDARQKSDLENHRLFLEFIDRDGKRICGDVSRGIVRSGDWRNGKPVIVSTNGLYTDFQYENHTGCYCYQSWRGPAGEYQAAGTVTPLTFRNDYGGLYDEVFIEKNGKTLYSPSRLKGVDDFMNIWLRNIISQGFDPERFEKII